MLLLRDIPVVTKMLASKGFRFYTNPMDDNQFLFPVYRSNQSERGISSRCMAYLVSEKYGFKFGFHVNYMDSKSILNSKLRHALKEFQAKLAGLNSFQPQSGSRNP